ncbi:Long-chain acyl-CoA synthetase (AMP-forming) [Phaeobacter inhibens]|uniref:Long-chain acyl-CoA synthetase (AMP-forming) n=2 Tax=Phaeobacter inhibens TaxID=221822 RepID=A0ABM6RI09_9RHOB|nr:Long-chain acyl-CoA synthetase (AMP-forming) [Phaeobacter inhibens]AUQ55880.1 Long-chain acyl-CoA synthetase (AMP-forming) [Phaeobacter inhibens]AUQ60066.1 Long-chain acyl-CoA synthetase (AMP-forming) [Phaeobacter inhibens]AUQ64107.1 Long-chain acyl-CoA synthetase (AMP-forming) [Phaeobacter inhibens]AUQ72042.1 Long-chain acyl-CoA synthetase (AMP-forming) [Phaeobacter inhibens]
MAQTQSGAAGMMSLPALLERNAAQIGDRQAYREKEFGIWQCWTWSETQKEIEALALGLINLGVNEGDFIAIIGRNRPSLYWAMVAAQSVGAVPVPLYQDAVAEEMAYVLGHCGARFVIAGDQEQVDKVIEVQEELSNLEQIIYLDPRGMRKYDHHALHEYAHVQDQGRAARDEWTPDLEARKAKLTYDSTCVMLYTSGTTGKPKGVVLSNRNVIESAKNSAEFDKLTAGENILSYLPMAWVGDFIFSVGQAYWCGFCVNCPESADTMMTDLREIGPTYFFAPPRVFEGQLTSVMIRMEDASTLKRKMFHHFLAHAKKVGGDILDGRPVGLMDRLKYKLGDLLVYGPLKDTLGYGRIRVGYTAGEAIGPEIFDFYRSLGINLKQLYGQTEATVFITVQPDGEVRADTVGVPAPDVEIKIADNGEIFYRSPGTFVEYYNNPESTASTKDAEGWVATGDAGFFEEDSGHLRIIDRAKDVGKMADGAMFAPKYVENKLKFYPDILEVVLFGNGRDRCVAFINIDLTAVGNWAERNNIAYASYQELAGHPKVLQSIREHVETVNESVAQDVMLSGCQVHRFVVLHKELDADDGEMTRTRKVRRVIVEDKYSDIITALYDGSSQISTRTEVTYEDGRKGEISATLDIIDAKVVPVTTQAVAAE